MAEIKWIKLSTNIFDNRKIKQIETLPDGYALIVMWIKLLCLSGTINDNGFIYLTKEIPYSDQMLATQFNIPLSTIQLGLKTFETFGMIETINDVLMISNWEKYQNIDKMEEIREYNRIAKRKSREKQKLIGYQIGVNDKSMTSQQSQEIDIDKDIKKEDIDIYKDNGSKTKRFVKPTLEEITNYISENNLNVNAQYWFDYYESNGWKVGKNPMKDWKACIRRWNKTEMNNLKTSRQKVVYSTEDMKVEELDAEALRNQLFGGKGNE